MVLVSDWGAVPKNMITPRILCDCILDESIYASKIHKNLYIYASQSKNWILIETERKNYIVSPENLDIIDVINK